MQKQTNGMAVAALVCGILGIVGGFIPVVTFFTFVLSVLGVIFGVKGRKMSTAVFGKPSGLATAGFILGIIGLSFATLGLLCTALCLSSICASGCAAADMMDMMEDFGALFVTFF